MLACVLHQFGRSSEAETIFRKAEAIQKKKDPTRPFFIGLQGFHYGSLLLSHGKFREVQGHASELLSIDNRVFDDALGHLLLGRAYMLQAQQEKTSNFYQALSHLERAVKGLRQAGTVNLLPRGLLARAELYRVKGDFGRARADLDEAMYIATRGGMGLHQADCHLEYARLYLAQGEKEKAREHLLTAKGMIGRMGYHLRDKEVQEIEKQLNED